MFPFSDAAFRPVSVAPRLSRPSVESDGEDPSYWTPSLSSPKPKCSLLMEEAGSGLKVLKWLPTSASFFADEVHALLSGRDAVWVLNAKTGKLVHSMTGHVYRTLAHPVFDQVLVVLTNSPKRRLRILNLRTADTKTDAQTSDLDLPFNTDAIPALTSNKDGTVLAVADSSETVQLVHLAIVGDKRKGPLQISMTLGLQIPQKDEVYSMCVDGASLYLGCSKGLVKAFNIFTGELTVSTVVHSAPVLCLRVFSDVNRVVTASADQTIMALDQDTLAPTGSLGRLRGDPLTLSGSGNTLVWAIETLRHSEATNCAMYIASVEPLALIQSIQAPGEITMLAATGTSVRSPLITTQCMVSFDNSSDTGSQFPPVHKRSVPGVGFAQLMSDTEGVLKLAS
ncbi:MAG: uncharacterized protein KVP18_003168 [Porospora cf. gigantea A]|uniref:uncharacterized protein n=1 Tax=Porospora cf. gigantea A TaxID=2853593 RepID=UPI003559D07C|nr:MAG: hypothetical protein KVP18_003168 [Porospora cf. gigantea A]